MRASNFVKSLAFSAAMSATACAGVETLVPLTPNVFIQVREVNAHPDLVSSLFGGNYNRGAPFGRFRDWCNDVLLL